LVVFYVPLFSFRVALSLSRPLLFSGFGFDLLAQSLFDYPPTLACASFCARIPLLLALGIADARIED